MSVERTVGAAGDSEGPLLADDQCPVVAPAEGDFVSLVDHPCAGVVPGVEPNPDLIVSRPRNEPQISRLERRALPVRNIVIEAEIAIVSELGAQ